MKILRKFNFVLPLRTQHSNECAKIDNKEHHSVKVSNRITSLTVFQIIINETVCELIRNQLGFSVFLFRLRIGGTHIKRALPYKYNTIVCLLT